MIRCHGLQAVTANATIDAQQGDGRKAKHGIEMSRECMLFPGTLPMD